MFSLFQSQPRQPYKSSPALGSSLLSLALLCIGFGIAILAAPQLLAYLVASLLLVIGITLLTFWYRIRR